MSWTHATGDIGEAEIAAVGGETGVFCLDYFSVSTRKH
jgi:hypothetical protein